MVEHEDESLAELLAAAVLAIEFIPLKEGVDLRVFSDKLIDVTKRSAVKRFNEDGSVQPQAAIVARVPPRKMKQMGHTGPALMVVHAGKLPQALYTRLVRELARATRAATCIHAIEAWYLDTPGADDGRPLQPIEVPKSLQHAPGRKEGIIVSIESDVREAPVETVVAEIMRGADGKGTLAPWSEFSGGAFLGPFANTVFARQEQPEA